MRPLEFAWLATLGLVLLAGLGCRSVSRVGDASGLPFEVPDPPAETGAVAGNLSVGSESLLVTWVEPMPPPTVLRLRFSRWRHRAWSSPKTIVEGPQILASWADAPGVGATEDGRLVAHWVERGGASADASEVVLAQSLDEGKTWSRIGPAHDDGTPTEHGFVSLLGDGKAMRAFWLDGRELQGGTAASRAMTLRAARIQSKVQDGILLDARVCDCCGTSAALTSKGAIVVFRDRTEDEVRDISIIRLVNGAWTAPRPVHADGWKIPGCPMNGPAVAADGMRVAVAWYTYANGRASVNVAFSGDAGEQFSEPIEVDGPRGRITPIGRVGIVLDDQGALVSWVVSEHERAQVLVRRVLPDKRRSSRVLLTASRSDRASGFPRLARLADELFLVWTQATSPPALRFASWPLSAVPPAGENAADDASSQLGPIAEGSAMPEYTARGPDGEMVSLASLLGEVVLLNFWATWCEPCRTELPEFAKLHERFGPRGLRVIGVSLDSERTLDEIKAFGAAHNVGYPLWLDSGDLASQRLRIGTLPATVVIARDGTVLWTRTGVIAADDLSLNAALDLALERVGR